MEKSPDRIKEIPKKHEKELKEKYEIKDIGIFGSYLRGEAKEESDLDILVEFEKPIGFFKFLELEEYLSNLIGIKVDLVSKKALKPHIGKYILKYPSSRRGYIRIIFRMFYHPFRKLKTSQKIWILKHF